MASKQTEENKSSSSSSSLHALPRPLVVAGPSGSGKSTLLKKLLKEYPDDFGFSVSREKSFSVANHLTSCITYKLFYFQTLSFGAYVTIFQYRWFFMGYGFTSGGQESGSVFSAAVCKIQASKCYIKFLPLVLRDKRSCFSQSERPTIQLPLECTFALRK